MIRKEIKWSRLKCQWHFVKHVLKTRKKLFKNLFFVLCYFLQRSIIVALSRVFLLRQLWIVNYYVKNNLSSQNKHSNQVNSTLGQINVTYLLSQLRWKVIWKTSKLLKNVIAIHSRPFIHISEKKINCVRRHGIF